VLLSLRALAAATVLQISPSTAIAADEPAGLIPDSGDWARGNSLYLEVTLNGSATGQLVHFDDRDGELYTSLPSLRQLGFVLPADTADPVRLIGLSGVSADYDVEHQRVAIQAPLQLLDLKTALLNTPENALPDATSSTGLLLNYDLYGTRGNDIGSVNAAVELRAFAGHAGVFSNTAIARMVETPGDGWHADSERLDSSWRFSFPDSMLQLTLGDTTTGALAWTRATRIGGIEIARDFALQPYRLTTPLPAFFGEASVPSAVDLYVNGIRQYSGHVPAGPFQLTTIPTINGTGLAQIVMTDAFGRSSTIELPFYGTRQLLQKGLSDWSADLGVVRENYGLSSFDYADRPMASGSLRYGWSDRFTVEAHAEGTSGLANGGVGGVLQIGSAGVMSGAFAHSRSHGDSGSQFSLGYNWTNNRYNFAVDSTRTRGDYRDVAALYGHAPPRISERAIAGINTASAGNFGVNYLRLHYSGEPASRYAGAYWSQSFGGNLSLNVSANQNLDNTHDRSVFLGVAYALNRRTNLNAGVQHTRDNTTATVDVSSPVPGDGGFGWRAQTRSGAQGGGLAEVGWLGNQGQLSGGVSAFGDSDYAYGDATGALVWMGGHVFAARHVDDAFAVISTDGVADVPVKLENRVLGRTDGDGMLLVTRLDAYQRNQLSINPMDLPANTHIDRVDAAVTPSDRAGILVRFGITSIRAASLILHDANGHALELGSNVRIEGQPAQALVGYDGVVYLEGLAAHNLLNVTTSSGLCRTQFDYPPDANGIPEIGPLVCVQEKQR
jgi:outer membrane usher protein